MYVNPYCVQLIVDSVKISVLALSHFSDVEKEPPVSIEGNKWDKEIPRSPDRRPDATIGRKSGAIFLLAHCSRCTLRSRKAPAPKEQRRILVGRKVSTGERESLRGIKKTRKRGHDISRLVWRHQPTDQETFWSRKS